MLEKINEKLVILDCLKNVVDYCEREKENCNSTIHYYTEKLNESEDEYCVESWKTSIDEYSRKISAYDEIVKTLGKLL